MAHDALGGKVLEVKLKAAGQHGDREFLRVRGGQEKLHMGGRLFQGFQQGVEARGGQHVHLVDEVHLEPSPGGRVLHVIEELARVFHLGSGGGVHLDQIDKAAFADLPAATADPTGRRADPLLAVQAPSQNARHRRFPHTTGSGEQIGVVETPPIKGVGKGPEHMLLPHHGGKVTRAPLPRQHFVGHGPGSCQLPIRRGPSPF